MEDLFLIVLIIVAYAAGRYALKLVEKFMKENHR